LATVIPEEIFNKVGIFHYTKELLEVSLIAFLYGRFGKLVPYSCRRDFITNDLIFEVNEDKEE